MSSSFSNINKLLLLLNTELELPAQLTFNDSRLDKPRWWGLRVTSPAACCTH